MDKTLQQACTRGDIRLLDLHIGRFLEQLADPETHNPELLLAATLAAAAVGNGHVCQPLDQVANLPLHLNPAQLPAPDIWRKHLLATSVVGCPGETTPLILDACNRLYLYRFFLYEKQIAEDLRRRSTGLLTVDHVRARQLLDQLFPDQSDINDQKTAAGLALLKRLLVISGGPGTGKTHTVARILALVQALHDQPLRIGLAAPTGKAAARMEESIRAAKQSMPTELAQAVPEQAQTLHRLLGFRPGADDFRYNPDNRLHLDLLVVDEASMIDVVLMSALLQALPAHTHLLLLGDRNQLASVEAGSLFSDLCGNGQLGWSKPLGTELQKITGTRVRQSTAPAAAMQDSVVLLRTSYRFEKTSGIGTLASAVNKGSVDNVQKTLTALYPDLKIYYAGGRKRETWLHEQISKGFGPMLKALSVEKAFAAMEQFRFLCAVRKGPAGVEEINRLARQVLRRAVLIAGDTDWYQGKPIIIRRNQYEMQLFNGDTGLLWNDNQGKLKCWFRRPDNTLYPVTPARLPEHDTAYGITIHKAQGSEFDQVLLLLPEEESRILSRELIYTGITRARSKLILCATPEILATAVKQRTTRHSGLAEKLWAENHGQVGARAPAGDLRAHT